jgi:hypothetical protein
MKFATGVTEDAIEIDHIQGCSSGYTYCSSSGRSISKNGDADMPRSRTYFLIHRVADERRPQSSLCKRPHFIHVAIAVSAPVVADHIDVGATPDII